MPSLDPARSIVFHGDWASLAPQINPRSAHLIYADPPFGTGRDFDTYQDIDQGRFKALIAELINFSQNALVAGGTLWIHGSQESSDRVRRMVDAHPTARRIGVVEWERIYAPKKSKLGLSNVLDEIVIVAFDNSVTFNSIPFDDDSRNLHRSWDHDPRPWISGDYSAPRADEHPSDVYGIQNPLTGVWHYPPRGRRWSRSITSSSAILEQWAPGVILMERDDLEIRSRIAGEHLSPQFALGWTDLQIAEQHAHRRLAQGCWPELIFGRTGRGGPRLKRYQHQPGKVVSTLWRGSDVGWIQDARAQITAAVPHARGFSTPKPERLLRRIIEMTTTPGDLVIDPFAGSGTTAVVAHALGRRFITAEISAEALETYVLPRLAHVDRGEHHWGDTSLVEPLPFKVRRGEAIRAAEVLTSFASDGRLDGVDPQTLTNIRALLRRSEACVANEPHVAHRFAIEVQRRTLE